MEPLAFFVGVFTTLADRIEKLKSTDFQNRKDFFNEIIRPIFTELEPVALNYMNIFQTLKKSLDKSSLKDLHTILQEIRDERNALLMARIKVEQMVKQIKELIKDKEVEAFADSVLLFFYGAIKERGTSRTYQLIEMLEQVEENYYSDEMILKVRAYAQLFAIDVLKDLEDQWKNIITSYEKIRIFSTTPLRFLKSRR